MKNLRVAAVQYEHSAADKPAHLRKIRHFVSEAVGRNVEMIVFPECCLTGYWFLRHLSRYELVSLAEPVPAGPSTRSLLELARKNQMTRGRAWLMRWLPARAHDNGLFLVFSNGVGMDDDEVRTGNAMVIDPYGRVLAETCRAGDEMVVADLDGSLLEDSLGRRWIRIRRPELYGSLTQPTSLEEETRSVRMDKKGV